MERQAVKRKKEEVLRITEKMERAVSFFIVDYSGLNANAMNSLRGKFKRSNFEYFVIKNSILERVGDNLGLEEITKVLKGPNAISISYEDPVGPAKIINEFYKENNLPVIKLCYIEGKWFLASDVKRLAELPPKEVLLGQVVNLLNSPIYQFVNLLKNVVESFVRVIDAVRESKNGDEDVVKKVEESPEKKEVEVTKDGDTSETQPEKELSDEVKEEEKSEQKEETEEKGVEEETKEENNSVDEETKK